MKLYEDIYFAQGEDAWEDIEEIDDLGAERFARDLIDMFYAPGAHPCRQAAPWGEEDELYHLEDGFVLLVNRRIGSVGLTRVIDTGEDSP